MMDRNEQVGIRMISAHHTLEQTGELRPARDQADGFVESCLMERLRNRVGELQVKFVFWRGTGTVGAGRSGSVTDIN